MQVFRFYQIWCTGALIIASCVVHAGGVGTSAFNELLFVQPEPKVQLEFPYNIVNTDYATLTTATGGTTSVANSLLSLTTTTTSGSLAKLASNYVLNYQSGQGSASIFTAVFTTGVANNIQIIGVGSAASTTTSANYGVSDGFFFGYNGTSFGILWMQGGQLRGQLKLLGMVIH